MIVSEEMRREALEELGAAGTIELDLAPNDPLDVTVVIGRETMGPEERRTLLGTLCPVYATRSGLDHRGTERFWLTDRGRHVLEGLEKLRPLEGEQASSGVAYLEASS